MSDYSYRIEKISAPIKGFKRVRIHNQGDYLQGFAVVELLIPAGARVGSYGGVNRYPTEKHRASIAKVISIKPQGRYRMKPGDKFVSGRDWDYTYWVGKTVFPIGAAYDMSEEACASGIHFFPSLRKAQRYSL